MSYANATAVRDNKAAEGTVVALKMAVAKVYKGSLVTLDASGYATYAQVGANLPFAGVAYETVDNTGGSAGDKTIRVWVSGVFSLVAASAAQAWVGTEVWLDSGSSGSPVKVAHSDPGATALKVGVVTEVVSQTEVRVRVNGYAMKQLCDGS